MTSKEKIDEFVHYAGMTEEERAAVVDTGFFNSYISAYLTLTLRELFGTSDDERIAKACKILNGIMDDTSALQAKETAKKR